MANDSSTGGYLAPAVASPPLEDADLDAIFQAWVVGITGLAGSLVRPRWQTTVPLQPPVSTNWCALGVSESDRDVFPTIQHDGTGDGSDTLIRNQIIDVLMSFYGPNGMRYANTMADGAMVPQNNEALLGNGIALVETGRVLPVPDFFNEQWIRRYDLQVRVRRQVTRTYAVLNVLSADGTVNSDPLTQPFSVSQ